MQVRKPSYFETFYVICGRSWTEGPRHIEEPATSKHTVQAEAEAEGKTEAQQESGEGEGSLCLEAAGKSQRA